MANIYNQQQVSNYANEIHPDRTMAKYVQAQGQEWVKEGEQQVDKAKQSYNNFMQSSWQNAMNELANDPKYASNPQALQEQAKKLQDKMSAEIVDNDVKMDFLVNANIKGQSYLNNAYAHARKIEAQRAKDSAYTSVYSNIDSIGRAGANVVLGVANGNDAAAYGMASKGLFDAINAVDTNGNFIFTAEQRKKMGEDLQKSTVYSLQTGFDNLTDANKVAFADKISKERILITRQKNKDGTEKDVYLDEFLSPKEYRELKKYAMDNKYNSDKVANVELKHQESLDKQNRAKNEAAFSLKSSDMNSVDQLNELESMKWSVSEKYYKAKREAILSTLALTPKTNAETFATLLKQINEMDANDAGTFVEETDDVLTKIEEKVASGELLRKDKDILVNAISAQEKPSIEKIGDAKTGFFDFRFTYNDASKYIKSNIADESKEYDTMLNYYRSIEGKGYNQEERRQLLSGLVERNNRSLFLQGKTKNGSTLGLVNSYFVENLPQNYQEQARNSFVSKTEGLNVPMNELNSKYKEAAADVVNEIQQNIRVSSQEAYKNIMSKSDSEFISDFAQKKGKSVEVLNKDIDETARKYGITREQVINRLKGAV